MLRTYRFTFETYYTLCSTQLRMGTWSMPSIHNHKLCEASARLSTQGGWQKKQVFAELLRCQNNTSSDLVVKRVNWLCS